MTSTVTISDRIIKKESGEYDPEVVKRLKIERYGLSVVSGLSGCISLVELSLAYNEITQIDGLSALDNLKRLDLSFNKIKRIENLMDLVFLEHLNLVGNQIESISEVEALMPMESLNAVYFQNLDGSDANPVCKHPSYVTTVQRMLPNLQVLDGGHLLIFDAAQAFTAYINNIMPNDALIDEVISKNSCSSWYSNEDLLIENGDGDMARDENGIRPFHCKAHTLEALDRLEEDIVQIETIVDRDSVHLLRKAGVTINKFNNGEQ